MDRAKAIRELADMVRSRMEELNAKAELAPITDRVGKRPFNLILAGDPGRLKQKQVVLVLSAIGFDRDEMNDCMILFLLARQPVERNAQPRKRWRGFGRRRQPYLTR